VLFAYSLKCSEQNDERHGYQAIEKLILDLRNLAQKCGVEADEAERKARMERLRAQIDFPLEESAIIPSPLKGLTILPSARILFDEDLTVPKPRFGRVTQLRVVVLGSADTSMILVLSKISRLPRIGDDTHSYELVKRVSQLSLHLSNTIY
jgi:hypothetical protein